jgi:hypothetical protein
MEEFRKVLNGQRKPAVPPRYWDGKAAQRILQVLVRDFSLVTSQQEKVDISRAML